jgi:hypothetical protein
MMLRCDRILLVGALIYRKSLSAITNRLEPLDKGVIRFNRSLYRRIVRRAEADRLSITYCEEKAYYLSSDTKQKGFCRDKSDSR